MITVFRFAMFNVVLIQICYGIICNHQHQLESSRFRNAALQGHIYINVVDRIHSDYFCFDLCMKDSRCQSFNIFADAKRLCQLNNVSKNEASETDLISNEKSTFYNLPSAKLAKVNSLNLIKHTHNLWKVHYLLQSFL